jgi:hypothetical protein
VHVPHHVTVAHRLAFVPPSHLHALRYINGLQISIPQCNTPVSYFNIKARITQDLYVLGKNVVSVVAYDASSACADVSSWAFMAVHTLTEARLLWVTMRENSRLFFAHWRQLSLQYLQVFSRAPVTLSHVTPAPTFVMVTEWLPLLDATADQSQSHHMWAMAASAGIRTVVIARDCEGSFRSFPGGIQNRSAVSSLMDYLNSQPSVQVVCDSDRSSVQRALQDSHVEAILSVSKQWSWPHKESTSEAWVTALLSSNPSARLTYFITEAESTCSASNTFLTDTYNYHFQERLLSQMNTLSLADAFLASNSIDADYIRSEFSGLPIADATRVQRWWYESKLTRSPSLKFVMRDLGGGERERGVLVTDSEAFDDYVAATQQRRPRAPPASSTILFMGCPHPPNVAGVAWFLLRVLPLIDINCPQARARVLINHNSTSVFATKAREIVSGDLAADASLLSPDAVLFPSNVEWCESPDFRCDITQFG